MSWPRIPLTLMILLRDHPCHPRARLALAAFLASPSWSARLGEPGGHEHPAPSCGQIAAVLLAHGQPLLLKGLAPGSGADKSRFPSSRSRISRSTAWLRTTGIRGRLRARITPARCRSPIQPISIKNQPFLPRLQLPCPRWIQG
jgi:hypothetical protein